MDTLTATGVKRLHPWRAYPGWISPRPAPRLSRVRAEPFAGRFATKGSAAGSATGHGGAWAGRRAGRRRHHVSTP